MASVGVWSETNTTRVAIAADLRVPESDRADQSKSVVKTSYRHKLLPFGSIEAGVEVLALQQTVDRVFPFGSDGTQQQTGEGVAAAPFVDIRYRISQLQLQAGWRSTVWMGWLGNRVSAEPRVAAHYALSARSSVGVDYGISTQAPSPYEAAIRPREVRQWSAFWHFLPNEHIKWSWQVYQQQLYHLAGEGTLSALNQWETLQSSMQATGRGRTRGMELSLQRFAGTGWWYVLSGSLLDARYQDANDQWQHTRFSHGFASALTIGKEWHGMDKKGTANRLGINTSLQWRGGLRTLPILLEASRTARTTVFDYDATFAQQLPDYFRMDLRVYYQKNHEGWNSMLSLDIQNATGYQNTAYQYYDRLLDAVQTRYQLEFIPIISYRVNF
ncbi:MAG: TonB-dependent receptor [Saprospiraceae bacterium]